MRFTGPEIAESLGMASSTVSAVLGRIGLGKLSRLEPAEPVRRYERSRSGELIHIDVKKLGRIGPHGAGQRVARARLVKNGSAYVSTAHALAPRALGIRHIRTRPYRPQTNGKAERFIRTMLDEWAYGAVYGSSPERAAALSGWLERYNYQPRHGAIGTQPPIARLRELR